MLELLAERAELTVKDVATMLDCSRSSAYRVVRTLQDREWVSEARFGAYELGPRAAVLGVRAIHRVPLRRFALPWMTRLSTESQETVTLSLLVGDERVCIDQVESPRQIRMTVAVGQPYPLYAGASGKAILMAMDAGAQHAYLNKVQLHKLAPNTILSRSKLARALAENAARGYVVSVAERDPEAFSVAAPVLDRAGVIGSIAVCGPASRFDEKTARALGRMTADAAAQISNALGATLGDGHASALGG